MPGQFSKSNRPQRPGAYFNWEAVANVSIPPSTGSTIALPFTHDWGPEGIAVHTTSFADWVAVYGSTDGVGYRAAKQAFQGEGDEVGRGGAGEVVAFRYCGSAGAKSTVTISNTAGTPAAALALTAKYKGTKGNRLRVSSINNAGSSTNNYLVVFLGTTEVERFNYPDTNINSLANQINKVSNWLDATVLVSGTALQTDATTPAFALQTPLTGGANGATITGTNWTDMLAQMEVERFSIFAPYGLVDAQNLAATVEWAQELNANGRRFMLIIGGGSADTVTDAIDRSGDINDPDVINLGAFTVTDSSLVNPATGNPVVLDSSQFVPRFAGVLASRGEALSATFARFQGVEMVTGATQGEILAAFDGGVVVLSRGTDPDAPVRVEKSLTTYTTNDDPTTPYLIFRQPKYVRTMHGIENEITEWLERDVIGRVAISDKVRDSVVGEVLARLTSRVATGVVQPNPEVGIDQDPPPTDEDEFIALVYGLKFGRSLEQVFNTVRVG